VRTSVQNAGVGIGMFAGAAAVFVFSLTFGFFALAEGLVALGLSRWLAFLVVFLFLLVVVGVLAFIGVRKVKRVKAPQRAIDSGKETVAYLREHAPRG
jgi:membrane protein implicated in regulation of membrane protease activity